MVRVRLDTTWLCRGEAPAMAESWPLTYTLFRPDAVDLSAVAKNVPEAQKIFNEVGWK